MRFTRLVTAVVAGAVVAASPAYAAVKPSAQTKHHTSRPRPAVSSDDAKAALGKVKQLFAVKTHGRHRGVPSAPAGSAPGRPDATMALRDLSLQLGSLSPADRAVAERYFLRPSEDGDEDAYEHPESTQTKCSTDVLKPVCVHWTPLGDDAPPITDDNADLIPDQVETTLATIEYVYQREVIQGGYRRPMRDGMKGGGPETDIYLANVGERGLFGYCTNDADVPDTALKSPAYCVLDNDFAEFGPNRLASLQVTAAHEFFHAIQFAYERAEDAWFMEGTATWVEDEIYDDVNDNYRYIRRSSVANPITRPRVPLDRFENSWQSYGGFVFWKKLTERYPGTQGTGLPIIVREIWERAADHRPRGASTMALSAELAQRGTTFGRFFRSWGVGNRFPALAYSEGAHYPTASLMPRGAFTLSPAKRRVATRSIRLDHMTNTHARFTPVKLRGKSWHLRVTVDAPSKDSGSFATLVVYRKNGGVAQVPIALNGRGNGSRRVVFGLGSVRYVELTLTNASNRFRHCYQQLTPFTCMGIPQDDDQRFTFRARVTR